MTQYTVVTCSCHYSAGAQNGSSISCILLTTKANNRVYCYRNYFLRRWASPFNMCKLGNWPFGISSRPSTADIRYLGKESIRLYHSMYFLCGKWFLTSEVRTWCINVLYPAYFYSCDRRDWDRTQVYTMQVEVFCLQTLNSLPHAVDIPTELPGCRLGSASSIIIVAYIALAFCETGEFAPGQYILIQIFNMKQSWLF